MILRCPAGLLAPVLVALSLPLELQPAVVEPQASCSRPSPDWRYRCR